jgi:manganese transport protein
MSGAFRNKGSPKTRIGNLRLLGPAFVAAVAYIDPGNYATNIQAGAQFGYLLLWIVLWASLMGVLIQLLSSKLGIATHMSLASLIRDRLPRWASILYWAQAEILAIATDLAEFVGASLGFKLLFGMSLLTGAICTAVVSCAILLVEHRGLKPLEAIIGVMLGIVALIYIAELILSRPDPSAIVAGTVIPRLAGPDSVLLGAGILGATVMPHVIYLHSALSRAEGDGENHPPARMLFRASCWDVGFAMTLASFVNLAMLAMAASVLHGGQHNDVDTIEQAYRTLEPALGSIAVHIFGLSLIIAGISSTVVGTLAGQEVMQDFVHVRIPVWVRRGITILPSFFVIWIGANVTTVLVMSQIVLSFGIALALVPLLLLTSKSSVMGELVNHLITSVIGWICVAIVVSLNLFVLFDSFNSLIR